MNDYDQDIARSIQRDGVRMASGQHITTTDGHDPCPSMPWAERAAQMQAEGAPQRDVERRLLDREFPDTDPDYTTGCWYDGQGVCTIHAHADNDLPEPADHDPWVDRRDHYDR